MFRTKWKPRLKNDSSHHYLFLFYNII
uniref:Uncharacterized protein n=1 Tax=Rhizophora mucronata TaxID=61149 RepID=A0A2P2PM78_RHIMU